MNLARQLQVIAVTGSLIYLHLPVGGGVLGHLEAQLAKGVGAAQLNRLTARRDQAHHRIGGGLAIAETALEHQLVGEAADPLQAAFD